MAGNLLSKYVRKIFKSFELRHPHPLDSRGVITSLAEIDVEVPVSMRHAGLLIWSELEKRSYIVHPDEFDDLVVFEKVMLTRSFVTTAIIDLSVTSKWTFAHSLNTADMQIKCINALGVEVLQSIEWIIDGGTSEIDQDNIVIDFQQWIDATAATDIPVGLTIIVNF